MRSNTHVMQPHRPDSLNSEKTHTSDNAPLSEENVSWRMKVEFKSHLLRNKYTFLNK
jgi:hypothetical protein